MASPEGNVISIVSCQLFFIERENITSDRVVLASMHHQLRIRVEQAYLK